MEIMKMIITFTSSTAPVGDPRGGEVWPTNGSPKWGMWEPQGRWLSSPPAELGPAPTLGWEKNSAHVVQTTATEPHLHAFLNVKQIVWWKTCYQLLGKPNILCQDGHPHPQTYRLLWRTLIDLQCSTSLQYQYNLFVWSFFFHHTACQFAWYGRQTDKTVVSQSSCFENLYPIYHFCFLACDWWKAGVTHCSW